MKRRHSRVERGRGGFGRVALLGLGLAMLAGVWLALQPAPTEAHGNPAIGNYNNAIRPVGETGNYCTNTRTYAANGGANTVDFRVTPGGTTNTCLSSTGAVLVGSEGWNWRNYAIKVAPTSADNNGGTGAIDGAHIEYVSGIASGTGSWRSVAGTTYSFRCVGSYVHCGSGLETGHIGQSGPGALPDLRVSFTVPESHVGPVKLVFTIGLNLGNSHDHATLTYGDPHVVAVPLAVPQDSGGTLDTGDVTAATRTYEENGASQRARVFLRDAWHSNQYTAAETNVARSTFDSATIKVTSDAAGATTISGATISSDAAGSNVITACTETAPGHTCTITSANFPQDSATPPLTTPQDIYFSVPSSHSGAAYLVVTTAQSGKSSRTFAAQYDDPVVPVQPVEPGEPAMTTPEVRMTPADLETDALSIYSGTATTAAAYLANRDGASLAGDDTIWLWTGGQETDSSEWSWSRYATMDGTPVAGSVDFPIADGDLLLGGAGPPPDSETVAIRGRPMAAGTQLLSSSGGSVEFSDLDETEALTLTSEDGKIIHEQLCPHIDPEHPLDTTPVATSTSCTITRAALMAFQQADAEDAVQRLDFVYIADSGSAPAGTAMSVWKVDGTDYEASLIFAHAPAPATDALEVSAFFDWADKGTDYATAGPTAMFAIGRSGTEVERRAMPSGLAWVRFEDLEDSGTAVRLSIDRGEISYNGEACPETEADEGCQIELTLAELMAERSAMAADLSGNLRVGYALPIGAPATLTVEAWADDAAEPVRGTLELGSPGAGAPVAAVTLPGDPDGMIAPSQTAEIAAGFRVSVDATGKGWSCAGLGPSFLELTGPQQLAAGPQGQAQGCLLARSAEEPPEAPAPATRQLGDDSYLVINGPATFEDGGGKRLRLDGTWSNLRCGPARAQGLADADDRDIACWVTNAAGERPKIVADADADADLQITANLAVADGRTLRLFTGAGESPPLDRFAEAAAFDLPDAIFGSGELRVGAVKELDRISLNRKPENGVVPTGTIAASSKGTELRLAILNENGIASRLSAVSSITVFATGGGKLSGQGCSQASSCSISTSSGALAGKAAAMPGAVAAIDLTYDAPATPGPASVSAAVVGKDGASHEETLELVISGPAATLSADGTVPRVHSMMTADDDRDMIKIPVSARDANGNAAMMPDNATATIRNPDGALLPSGSHSAEVECEGEARLKCDVVVIVLADPSNPLASGAYTATVSGRGIADAELGFTVAGPTETVTLELPEQLGGLADSFDATARAADKGGVAVADGTWVIFSTTATRDGTETVVVSRPVLSDHDGDADTARVRAARTKDGAAVASATIISRGVAVLTASADGKSASVPVDTRIPSADSEAPRIDAASPGGEVAAGSHVIYRGGARSTAAEVLALGPEGANAVWLWNGRRWLRYSETEGEAPPGSEDFIVLPDDILWFSEG